MRAYFAYDRKTGKYVKRGMSRGEYFKKRYGGLPDKPTGKTPKKILTLKPPKTPTKRSSPSVTSQYRGGSGKKKYNQAAYFAGLGVNPNTKQNQGIYKPYANGGGVRKPKYKE